MSEKEPTSELEVDENVAPATDEVQGSRKSTRRAVNNNSQNSQSSQSSQEKVIGELICNIIFKSDSICLLKI